MTKREKIHQICKARNQENLEQEINLEPIFPHTKRKGKEKTKIKRKREAVIKMIKEQQSHEKQM